MRVSFSGAGFLGAFHLGVGDALVRARALESRFEIAGASAGAIVGAVLATETPVEVAREALRTLVEKSRTAGRLGILTPGFSLVDDVRNQLSLRLPSDAHRMATGRLHVALTSIRPGPKFGHVYHKSSFGSRDELVDAVSSSSDIPGITGLVRSSVKAVDSADLHYDRQPGESAQRWLQALTCRRDVDGGLFDIFPDPWDGAHEVVFVSPFAGRGFAIAPVRQPSAPTIPEWSPIASSKNGRQVELSVANATRWRDAFFPPGLAALEAYEREGCERCNRWLLAQRSAASSQPMLRT